MKLTLLILTLAVSMATAQRGTKQVDKETEINSFIESLLLQSAKQQEEIGMYNQIKIKREYIRCMWRDYLTHTGIGQCANSKPHDIYRKSRYSPHTSDAQYAYVQYSLSLL